jgi:two-component system C4-dicarboxylate transport sensor histidine kinase DctB
VVLTAVVVVAVALLCACAWWLAMRGGTQRIEGELRDRLTTTLRAVESEVERFRYLPAVIGEDERIVDLLRAPEDVGAASLANAYLQTVREMSGADEIYLLDTAGLTLASSNWNEPGSFVGNNYGFRPYFRDAIEDGEGRYYAVGVTTGKPGYFLSARVDAQVDVQAARPIGVIVAKVDMAPLEQAWARAGDLTGLADDAGMVFLTGHVPWKYRPLYPLSTEDIAAMQAERRYDGIDLAQPATIAAEAPVPGRTTLVEDADGTLIVGSVAVEPDGWQLFSALPMRPVIEEARLVAGLAALGGLLVSAVSLFLWQRRQITRLRLEQNVVLERRVAERTEALAHEIEERKRTEIELRETQESLIHAAKLAALGRMSAAIVHEVSQPLSALDNTLAAAGLHAERQATPEVLRNLGSARGLLKRMQRTVKHLKTFSRKEVSAPEAVDIAGVIEAAREIVEPRAREAGVHIAAEIAPGLPAVSGSPIRLEQVLINLLLNAIDATATAGNADVTISAAKRGTRLAVRITDTGAGIPADIRERIFEPFFTTKTTGEGLGLGLSISRAILEEFGGKLSFKPQKAGGTLTLVELPLHARKPAGAELAAT